MWTLRKLTLPAALAIAASTLTTPSGFAQNEPLPHNQTPRLIVGQEVHAAADQPCPLVTPSPAPSPGPTFTTGGCRIHVTATDAQFMIRTSLGTLPYWECDIEFDMRLDSSGEGYLSHQEFISDGSCGAQACRPNPPTAEDRAWSVFLREAEPAPTERITFLLCIDHPFRDDGIMHCEYTLPVSQTTTHRYMFQAFLSQAHGASNYDGFCTLNGMFQTESAPGVTGEGQAEQQVEIRHT